MMISQRYLAVKQSPFHDQVANNAINTDVQKRRFALLLHASYGERYAAFTQVTLNG